MRDLSNLLSKIIEVIPESESSLKDVLNDNLESVRYAAPEMILYWFEIVQKNLYHYLFYRLDNCNSIEEVNEYLEANNCKWLKKVLQIWTGSELNIIASI